MAIVLICAGWLTGCVAPPNGAARPAGWQYADLRLVEADDPVPPDQDLLAVYARPEGADLRLRVDLLDHAVLPGYDLIIAIDNQPGGTRNLPGGEQADIAWDALLNLPARGELEVSRADGSRLPGSALFVLRDPTGDFVEIRLRRAALDFLPGGMAGGGLGWPQPPVSLQVFAAPAGGGPIADRTAPVLSYRLPPEPARALLAFWNAYPAYTPITALRRWDGAHTGPLGGRHGLYNLLRTAQAAEVPLTLLDLNTPAALSALDYTGEMEMARAMAQSGLLSLPQMALDPAYGPFPSPLQTVAALLEQGRETAAAFGLPADRAIYLPAGSPIAATGEVLIFERSTADSGRAGLPPDLLEWLPRPEAGMPLDPSELAEAGANATGSQSPWPTALRRAGGVTIPLPGALMQPAPNQAYAQAGRDGLEVDWRRLLARTALACAGQGCFLPLGGDLPASAWGDPQSARASLRWLKAHPWVQIVRPEELAAEAQRASTPAAGLPQEKDAWRAEAVELAAALEQAPDNPLGRTAWQAYAALFAPVYPFSTALPELREAYTGQVWGLIEAGEWADGNWRLKSQPGSPAGGGPANPADPTDTRRGDPFWMPQVSNAPAWVAPTGCADPMGLQSIEDEASAAGATRIGCSGDPDHDGQPECILTNEEIYAQIEIEDGTLTGLYFRPSVAAGAHQVVGPSSQFISGLSDPQTWQNGAGAAADPAVIPGAFSGPGSGYQVEVQNGVLALRSPDGLVRKVYQLTPRGLHVEYHMNGGMPGTVKIPLALDPRLRFQPGWSQGYGAREVTGGWEAWVKLADSGLRVQVISNAPSRLLSFQDSAALFPGPEDPNREFPAGHLLPFPLQVVEVGIPAGAALLSVDIILR